MKINGSVARKVLHDMEEEGKIKKVVSHARLAVYSESRSETKFVDVILIMLSSRYRCRIDARCDVYDLMKKGGIAYSDGWAL
jgi:hypothetical protein